MTVKTRKVDDATLAVLSRVACDGNVAFLPGLLERAQYLQINEVLSAAGGKWNKKIGGHVFEEDPSDTLDSILLSGEYGKPADYGYYPTPEAMVDEMVTLANLTAGMKVLEPSAGQGAIAKRAAMEIPREFILCVELLEDNCKALHAGGFTTVQGDFLNILVHEDYHRILMNPPFAKQQDIDHVTHALKFLVPGGLLIAIMASGVTFRENAKTKSFIDMLEDYHYHIRPNPEGSFKISGTMVNTITLFVRKPMCDKGLLHVG